MSSQKRRWSHNSDIGDQLCNGTVTKRTRPLECTVLNVKRRVIKMLKSIKT